MPTTLRLRADGRLLVCFDQDVMRAGLDLAEKRLGAGRTKHMPVELMDASFLADADGVVAGVADSAGTRGLAKRLGAKLPRLGAGAYCIKPVAHATGQMLLVVGGDRFGTLAGLSEALRWSTFAPPALTYDGGERHESPAFPLRFYWTWDHSTNWVLDEPGNQLNGCNNPYLKRPETFHNDMGELRKIASPIAGKLSSGWLTVNALIPVELLPF